MNVSDQALREALQGGAEGFTSETTIKTADRLLRGHMRRTLDPAAPHLGPIKYEIGVLAKGDRLLRAVKGTSASAKDGAASVDPVVLFQGFETTTGTVVTHNHVAGTPLSVNDIFAMGARGVVEVRAVGPTHTFVMFINDPGWRSTKDVDRIMAVMGAYAEGEKSSGSVPGHKARKARAGLNAHELQLGPTLAQDVGVEKLMGCERVAEKMSTRFKFAIHAADGGGVVDREHYLRVRRAYYT
jgi:hypothetical protein